MRNHSTAPGDQTSRPDLEDRVREALGRTTGVVLAVSGGRDSMALLHAAASVAPERVRVVATFDHATGPHASAAAELVAARASAYGLVCRSGRAPSGTLHSEAAWRAVRWRFLRAVAAEYGSSVATGHSRDDQLETVAIRILRHAGARGLAGLDTDSGIVRPWLGASRVAIAQYASRHAIPYLEDPSNTSKAHLRNRVRLDLLPALRRMRPGLDDELMAVSGMAAGWRRQVERIVAEQHPLIRGDDGPSVAAAALARYDAASLAVVWPVIAAGAGITLDRRGTARLVAFTSRGKVGGVIQLSGGIVVRRSRFSFVLERRDLVGGARAGRPVAGRG
jgi:tRNA(Ile)-lysidine synthase